MNKNQMIELLKRDVVPALGCTEPVCVALCAAYVAKESYGEISSVCVEVNAGIYKNGMSAGIPNCSKVGLEWAAAIGACLKNPEKSLELLSDMHSGIIAQSEQLVNSGKVGVTVSEKEKNLYVKCVICAQSGESICIIKNAHTNVVYLKQNGELLIQKEKKAIQSVDDTLVAMLKEMKISEIRELMSRIVLKVSSAAESRLDGCPLPTMSSSGAGTKGLVVILPVSETAKAIGADRLQTVRAIAFAHLVNRYINAYVGKLSPMCSCVMSSSTAAAAGITWLLGGTDEQIGYAIRNMTGTVTGMICDGGKVGCAMKVATGSFAALMSAMHAINNAVLRISDGICAETPEQCIKNMARVGNRGMTGTDKEILNIMTEE